ncbi:hypothetical protein OHB36_22070 [Streptomyces sp. NBC_00320]|uniref:hypothetical protein n=1 Tax=Streptomyces sp. NBC_00320 TaxID=2975711 RepID=UPI0022538293|nr:hypothetical protein [Streptomyces sp. NBC_00320]MCX5149429.1 hypothetical protein [Streptomyces sp. NBC_00320]
MTGHLLPGLGANPALPAELLDRLVERAASDPELADALSGRTDLGPARVAALAAHDEPAALHLAHAGLLRAADVDPVARPSVALALLDEGAGLPAWARLLAAHPDREIREALTSRPGLPPDVRETLAADPEVGVVAELARWTTEPSVAARLAAHPHAEVRRGAAANEATPPAALAALITGEGLAPARSCLVCDREEIPFTHDPYCPRTDCDLRGGAACAGGHESTLHEIRQQAARNPAAPPAAAASLAGHPSLLIRWALAERADLSQELYARLAEDPIPAVRAEVAGNPAIGEPLIRAMAARCENGRNGGKGGTGGDEVAHGLARHPRVPLDVLAHLVRAARIGPTVLPRIADASPAELSGPAASADARVRMLVGQRRDLAPELRDALAADPDAAVVKAVAPHPGLSEAQLRAMVALHGVRVLARVAANPDAPAALLEELARHDPPVRRVLREIAGHPNATAGALLPCLDDERARPRAARHPALPPAVLVGLLTDADPEVAGAAAANPSLPVDVMTDLLAGRLADR